MKTLCMLSLKDKTPQINPRINPQAALDQLLIKAKEQPVDTDQVKVASVVSEELEALED